MFSMTREAVFLGIVAPECVLEVVWLLCTQTWVEAMASVYGTQLPFSYLALDRMIKCSVAPQVSK